MSLVEIIVLGIALSADAFAVTISNTFSYPSESKRRLLLMPIFFGLFQGLMPLIGYFAGSVAASFIEQYAGIITLVILGFIGGNMVREGVAALRGNDSDEPTRGPKARRLTLATVLVQAVATAIDAFAVGVSLLAQQVDILTASSVIALTTFLCCIVALVLGRRLGEKLGDRAQVLGGVVLLIIGIKAFLS